MGQSIALRFRHATPRHNLPSILATGLDPARALNRFCKAVWLHSPSRTAWAIAHVAARHGVDPSEVAIIDIRIPYRWLTGPRRRGLWTVSRIIPPARIIAINPRAAIAAV
jgi:hypothetical protein